MAATFRLIVVLWAVLLPSLAFAHAQFDAARPGGNAIVLEMPETIELEFNEPVSPINLRWIAPDGSESKPEASADGNLIIVAPPPLAGDGSYLLSWRVVSIDGHPVRGTLIFSVGAPSEVKYPGGLDLPPASAWLVVASRFALSLMLIVGVGGTVFFVFVQNGAGGAGRVTRAALWLVLPLAVLAVGTQGVDLLGLSAGDIFTGDPWVTGASVAVFRTALMSGLAALAALCLTLRAVSGSTLARFTLGAAAWGLAAGSFAVSGHSGAAEPQCLAATAVVLHSVALIFWLGALVPLLGWISTPQPTAAMQRFSVFAVPLLAVLLMTGVVIASLQTGAGGFQSLAMSSYGVVLWMKVVAVAAMLILAAYNRLALTPALRRGDAGAEVAMRSSIRVEIILSVVIIAFASSFRLTPPPRTLTEESQPLAMEINEGATYAKLEISPGRVGQNAVVMVLSSEVEGFAPLEVGVAFALPDRGIEPIVLPAISGANGRWTAGPFNLPIAADWVMTVRVLVTAFEEVNLTGVVRVEP